VKELSEYLPVVVAEFYSIFWEFRFLCRFCNLCSFC